MKGQRLVMYCLKAGKQNIHILYISIKQSKRLVTFALFALFPQTQPHNHLFLFYTLIKI